jgi:hypothetical protein
VYWLPKCATRGRPCHALRPGPARDTKLTKLLLLLLLLQIISLGISLAPLPGQPDQGHFELHIEEIKAEGLA